MTEKIILSKKAKEQLNLLLAEEQVEKIFYKNTNDIFHCFIIQYEDYCTLFKTYFIEEGSDFFSFHKQVSDDFLDLKSFKEIARTNII